MNTGFPIKSGMTDYFLSLRGGLLPDVAVSEIAAHTACARNDSNSGFPLEPALECIYRGRE